MHIILINRKKIKKRGKKYFYFTTFRNTCNIKTPFELAWGKVMDLEYDYAAVC